MYPYIIILALLSVLSYADVINMSRYQRMRLLFLAGVILIFFAGLRYGDHDYAPYQMIFHEAQGWNMDASTDVGYAILNGLLGIIWNDPLIVFIAVAAISVTLNIKCFNDCSKYAMVALLFYFAHNYALKEMIQIRAGLACAIGLFNIRNITKGRYGKFWFWQIIAMTIHLGAVMFLIGWLLKRLDFSRKTWMFILAICFVVGSVYPFGSIIKSLPEISILERVQIYSQWGEYAESIGILTNMATVKQIFVCVVIFVFYDTFKSNIKHFDILAIMYLSSTCWLMLWCDFAIIGARMATFLSVGEPIILGSSLVLVTPNSRKLLLPLLIIMAFVFLLINMQGKILPYQFYPIV